MLSKTSRSLWLRAGLSCFLTWPSQSNTSLFGQQTFINLILNFIFTAVKAHAAAASHLSETHNSCLLCLRRLSLRCKPHEWSSIAKQPLWATRKEEEGAKEAVVFISVSIKLLFYWYHFFILCWGVFWWLRVCVQCDKKGRKQTCVCVNVCVKPLYGSSCRFFRLDLNESFRSGGNWRWGDFAETFSQ